MLIKKVVSLACAAALMMISIGNASFIPVDSPGVATFQFGNPGSEPGTPLEVLGDTVDAAVTAFNAGGGLFISGPATHTVGTSSTLPSAAPGLIPDHTMTTSVSDAGTTRTLSISIRSADGSGLAPAGLADNNGVFTDLFFEIPDFNGGPDLFDDPDKVGPAVGTFDLVDAMGGVLFSTGAGIDDMGTSFSVGNGIGAGGADIFSLGIDGGEWSISYSIVPEPTSLAMALGCCLLFAYRRR